MMEFIMGFSFCSAPIISGSVSSLMSKRDETHAKRMAEALVCELLVQCTVRELLPLLSI